MEREGRHLLSHASIYLVARGLPGAIAFAATSLFTHLLSPGDYWRYAEVLATVALLNALLFQWMRLAMVRYWPAHEGAGTSAAFRSTLLTANLALTVALGVVAAAAAFIPQAKAWRPILLPCWLLLAAQSLFELCCELSRAAARPWDAMRLQLTRSSVALGVGVGLVALGWGWLGALGGVAAGTLLAIAWAWRRDWSGVRPRIDRSTLARVARYGVPLSLTVALTTVISTSDRFLIAWRMGDRAAGQYSVAVDFTSQTLFMLLMVVYMAAFPLAVRAWERGGREAAARQMRTNAALLLAIGVPGTVGLSLLAPGIARCFLGAQFRETAAHVMPLVAIGTLLAGVKAYHFDAAFQFADRTMHQVWIVLAAAVLNVALNWLAIPRYGINGAAGASVIAYGASIGMTVAIGRRHFAMPFPAGSVARVAIAAVVMAAVLWPIRARMGLAALGVQTLLGAAAFSAALVATNFMQLRDHLYRRFLGDGRTASPESMTAVDRLPAEALNGGAA